MTVFVPSLTDCFDKKTSTMKYFSKTGKKGFVKQELSKKISSLIEEAMVLTENFIKKDDLASQYIFIKPYDARHVNKNKRVDFYHQFKLILGNIDHELEIKGYSPYNIRHTFIDTAFIEGVKHGLSMIHIAAITRNSVKTCILHYRNRENVDLYVETLAKVTISDVDINGNILKVEENKYSNIVMNNLGVCRNEHCVFELAECLRCNHFTTFINRIPVFERKIISINNEILFTSNSLEIEELNAVKKLLAKFLSDMIKMSNQGEKRKNEKC